MFQVVLVTLLQTVLSPLLVLWSLIFWLSSLWGKGNAVEKPKSVLITGASSGLGCALAVGYAKKGVTLGLVGRSKERLMQVSDICREKGAETSVIVVDVKDQKEMEKKLNEFNSGHPVDILIANAGISGSTSVMQDKKTTFYDVFNTNTLGVINTVLPLIHHFKNQRRGQIVIMSSLASEVGIYVPDANHYAASKAAVSSMAMSWRTELKSFGVGVTLIRPGFVQTPMTDKNSFSMPFIIDSEEASRIMLRGISADVAVLSYPTVPSLVSSLFRIIPENLSSMLIK
eukprot:TRINITY_DN10603_c0_g1_i1.p1 TRINITY_DN10603_c0_g1~~TRINITY_DN10603_c0_g1_i1.p1  ORF type:complete len:286 (+),score=60.91 TRINITY_DN10603_c0_g1_i1:90-947(+)